VRKWKRKRSDFRSAPDDKEIKDPVERELVQGDRARDEERKREWTSPIKSFKSGGLQNNDRDGPRAGTEDPEHQTWKGDDAHAVRVSEKGHEGRVATGFSRQGDGVHRQYSGPLQGKGKLKIFEEDPDIPAAEYKALIASTLKGRNATIMEGILDGRDTAELAAQFNITAAKVSRISYDCRERLRKKIADGLIVCPTCGKAFLRAQGTLTDASHLSVQERVDLIREQQQIMATALSEDMEAWNAVRIFLEGDSGRDDRQRHVREARVRRVREIEERLRENDIVYCSLGCAPFQRGLRPDFWKGKDSPISPLMRASTKIIFPKTED